MFRVPMLPRPIWRSLASATTVTLTWTITTLGGMMRIWAALFLRTSLYQTQAVRRVLNRFSYVLNDPVNLSDPGGHKPCWATVVYSCNLSSWTTADVKNEIAKYSAKDQPAVTAFFENQGFPASSISSSSNKNSSSSCDTLHCITGGSLDLTDVSISSGDIPIKTPQTTDYNGSDNSGGLREPDYGVVQVSAGPWLVDPVVTFSWADEHLYIAGGATLAKPLVDLAIAGIPAAANVSGGWLFQSTSPSPEQLHRFLTSWTINGSLGFGLGGGATWGNVRLPLSWSDFAGEGGIYTPQVGVSATYTVVDINLSSG